MLKMMVERKGNVRSYRVYSMDTVDKIVADRDSVAIGSRVVVVKGSKIVYDKVVM